MNIKAVVFEMKKVPIPEIKKVCCTQAAVERSLKSYADKAAKGTKKADTPGFNKWRFNRQIRQSAGVVEISDFEGDFDLDGAVAYRVVPVSAHCDAGYGKKVSTSILKTKHGTLEVHVFETEEAASKWAAENERVVMESKMETVI